MIRCIRGARIRRLGNRFELTKKLPVAESDASRHAEVTIPLTEVEYLGLGRDHRRRITKSRCRVRIDGHQAEVDAFGGSSAGLVLIGFEFTSEAGLASFETHAVCLADVTQESLLAGGVLAGKS
ncbi:hypothetical protein Mvan_5955 [Mycolicibacterium vanbaalenii PYR-1]|uniref:Uncharacterized protein n=1 Tax=Mycolicibacterium vanbaalenii (strain DSM 7251 / JCM 13017 / BCRC 16820 / KCTC 9966 / NRRL B-24157 / PYR-1) TaxID=350058 RepID=A1THR4_MYCVP|nr:hypothetical protein Mvan_5955 [Mycolicibacterium vanbaalenii PYR-1]